MLQTYDFGAGGRMLAAQGNFFLYQSSNSEEIGADSRIVLRVDGGSLGTLEVGDSIAIPQSASQWEIVPIDPLVSGAVVVGHGEVNSARLSGTVKVIENEIARTRMGRQFWTSSYRPGTAGTFSTVGLFNTSAVDSIAIHGAIVEVATNTIGLIYLTQSAALSSGASSYMRNKMLGAALSTRALTSTGLNTTNPPTADVDFTGAPTVINRYQFRTNGPRSLSFGDRGPLILGPQKGFFVVCETANVNLSVEFECEELAPAGLPPV